MYSIISTYFIFQFSPAWDFFITCLGMSYVLWNPFLFWFFNPKFQEAFKEFFREEVRIVVYNLKT